MGQWLSSILSRNEKDPSKKVDDSDYAILQLKSQRQKLIVYRRKITKLMEKELEQARTAMAKSDKERALIYLKKKKYQENLLKRTETRLDNLATLVDRIEEKKIELEVMEGLKEGTAALKELQKEMSLEDVERIMDESQEAIEYQKEISAALSRKLSDEDNSDIEADLKELENEILEEQLQDTKVPSTKLKEVELDVEDSKKAVLA